MGAYSAPLTGGRALAAPPQELLAVALNFMPHEPLPPKKGMGSLSNQNCCKGFRFTEKVDKHNRC